MAIVGRGSGAGLSPFTRWRPRPVDARVQRVPDRGDLLGVIRGAPAEGPTRAGNGPRTEAESGDVPADVAKGIGSGWSLRHPAEGRCASTACTGLYSDASSKDVQR
jgi:hypothetical protein